MRMPRKVSWFLVINALCLVAFWRAGWAQNASSPAFTLTISTDSSSVREGSEIAIDIDLKNTQDHDILMWREKGGEMGEFNYIVHILNQKGEQPPETKYHRAVRGKGNPDQVIIVTNAPMPFYVKPGEILKDKVDLSKLFELSPGKYTVQAERLDATTKQSVKSNTITIIVRP